MIAAGAASTGNVRPLALPSRARLNMEVSMDNTAPAREHAAYDVYLRNRLVTTVFYSGNMTADEVRISLINHDNMHPEIRVVKRSGGGWLRRV